MTKNKERLEKLHRLWKKARKLTKMLNDECELLCDEIRKQDEFAQDCESRATNQTWDGKQPDFWYERERIWRKATKDDIGKDILVGNFPQVSPLLNEERVAKLEHITTFGEFTTKDTKEDKIIHWHVGWVPSDHEEMQAYRAGKFVSVVLANKLRATRKEKQIASEQADPLIDGDESAAGRCTVAEEKWSPKVGEWVRIKKCDTACFWVGIEMDYLDGQIRQIEELTTDGSAFVVDNFWLCGNCIEPWEPREGEKVQVINTDRVYEVEGFDKISKMVFCVGRSLGIELRLLKPYIEPQPEPANSPEIPEGWRELRECETRQKSDMFEWQGEWVGYMEDDDPNDSCFSKYDLKHIRKIEPANTSETPKSSIEPEVAARHDSEGRDVTNLPGLHDEGDAQYREPTYADLANGPIEVEVCDHGNPDGIWHKRKLYAVLPKGCAFRFIVARPSDPRHTTSYRHARIKIGG